MITTLYALLTLLRFLLAIHYRDKQQQQPVGPSLATTIVQPILSGDPDLAETLYAVAQSNPTTPIFWLLDEDDAPALQLVPPPNVRVITGPPPRDGENPKLIKLERALPFVNTEALLVLDDDTVLPDATRLTQALHHAALVTGLPTFAPPRNLWEAIVEAFVNGNATLTYLPAAALHAQRTINGMVYLVRTEQIRQLGGFAAAGHELTDDYAVARLYLRHGLPLMQSTIRAHVHITVDNAAHCISILRRWMIFANRYLRDHPATALLVGAPMLLPALALLFGEWRWVLPAVFAKAIANRILLGQRPGLTVFMETLSDLLMPLYWLTSLIRPARLRWRRRNINISDGVIRYH